MELAERLIPWYLANEKSLPWREDPAPYHVWISEIMLQQTRIEAVIPYYRRFLSAFPTVAHLAAADDDLLMKCWEGLGYYSRARNLKRAAIEIMADHGGCLPETAKALEKLPGIGPYTAGAIASIAFGKPAPAVDGNVFRVVTRLLLDGGDIGKLDTRARVTAFLAGEYPEEGEGCRHFTQALMELGQEVCIPVGAPRCDVCPLKDVCEANREGRQAEFPVKAPKAERRIEKKTVLLFRAGGRYALRRRAASGLLAGMWELPNFEGWLFETDALAVAEGYGLSPIGVTPLGDGKHVFTHIEWHMKGYLVECEKESDAFLFASAGELAKSYAVPSAFRAYRKYIE